MLQKHVIVPRKQLLQKRFKNVSKVFLIQPDDDHFIGHPQKARIVIMCNVPA